jgi:hypothetical protein
MPDYTEEEVNRMLAEQSIKIRLEGVETSLMSLREDILERMAGERGNYVKLMAAIENGSNERRQTEANLRAEMSVNHREYHTTFVKKTDLKLYAFLVISAVTFTTGFITWMGNQNTNKIHQVSVDEIVKQIELREK